MGEKRTVVGAFVHSRWINLNLRCANGKYRLKYGDSVDPENRNLCYETVLLNMSRDQFRDWCWTQETIIKTLAQPSLDRIDKSIGYQIGNIQIIELAANIRKDKTVFRDGFGTCFRCKQQKPETEFVVDRKRQNGFRSVCRICERARCKLKYAKAKEVV